MEKEDLIDELIDVCFELELFKVRENIEQKRHSIKTIIEDVTFVETFYIEIFKRAKKRNIVHTNKIMKVLLKLEKARLELEKEDETSEKYSELNFTKGGEKPFEKTR